MEAEAAKLIGAGLAVIGMIGSGIGIGSVFSSFIIAVGRNPAARGEVFKQAPHIDMAVAALAVAVHVWVRILLTVTQSAAVEAQSTKPNLMFILAE